MGLAECLLRRLSPLATCLVKPPLSFASGLGSQADTLRGYGAVSGACIWTLGRAWAPFVIPADVAEASVYARRQSLNLLSRIERRTGPQSVDLCCRPLAKRSSGLSKALQVTCTGRANSLRALKCMLQCVCLYIIRTRGRAQAAHVQHIPQRLMRSICKSFWWRSSATCDERLAEYQPGCAIRLRCALGYNLPVNSASGLRWSG